MAGRKSAHGRIATYQLDNFSCGKRPRPEKKRAQRQYKNDVTEKSRGKRGERADPFLRSIPEKSQSYYHEKNRILGKSDDNCVNNNAAAGKIIEKLKGAVIEIKQKIPHAHSVD